MRATLCPLRIGPGSGLITVGAGGYPGSLADYWLLRLSDGTRPFGSRFPQPGRLAVAGRLGHWPTTTRQNTLFRLPILSY